MTATAHPRPHSGSALTGSIVSADSGRKPMPSESHSMKNWAGNLEYSSADVSRPESVAELASIVAASPRIKALGSRHSFNRVGDTDGVHVLLDSLPHISVAGAVQTGTHGSGVNNPALAGAVESIDLVRASGEQVTLTLEDGDEFLASVVGIGALGIVTGLELAVRPSFRMRQRVLEDLPWDNALGDFAGIVSSAYSVSLFTDYAGSSINQVWLKALDGED